MAQHGQMPGYRALGKIRRFGEMADAKLGFQGQQVKQAQAHGVTQSLEGVSDGRQIRFLTSGEMRDSRSCPLILCNATMPTWPIR